MQKLLEFEQGIITAERPFNPFLKPDPVHYYNLEAMLDNPQLDLVLAELDGEPVACGYARVEPSKSYNRMEQHAYLGMMYVVPHHRGEGINALIIEALKDLVRQRGIRHLCLEVFHGNASAIKAYQKAGFKEHMIEMWTVLD